MSKAKHEHVANDINTLQKTTAVFSQRWLSQMTDGLKPDGKKQPAQVSSYVRK